MLKMDTVPMAWDGWAYLNEPREREDPAASEGARRSAAEASTAQQYAAASGGTFSAERPAAARKSGDPLEDDIPF